MSSDLERRVVRLEQLVAAAARTVNFSLAPTLGRGQQAFWSGGVGLGSTYSGGGDGGTGVIACGDFEVPAIVYFNGLGQTNVALVFIVGTGWQGTGSDGTTFTLAGDGTDWNLIVLRPAGGGFDVIMAQACDPWQLASVGVPVGIVTPAPQ